MKGWPTRDITSPACHGERYLGPSHEGVSSRSAPRLGASAGLDSLRASHLRAEMDAGDTGTEEAAKERPDPSPPCGDSPRAHASGRSGGRSDSLGLLTSPSLARRRKSMVCSRGARRARSSERASATARLENEADCGPPRSECARPRGSARTSKYVAEVGGRCLAPNKFSERAAKTAADESERGPRRRGFRGQPRGSGHRRDIRDSAQWRPRATAMRKGPGWRHERHSAARLLERGSGRVPRPA